MKQTVQVGKTFDHVLNTCAGIAIAIVYFMMFAVCAEIVFRYFLHMPIRWVVEITSILLLYMTFLATAWLLREEGHVTIDLLFVRFTPRVQNLFSIIVSIIGAALSVVMIWYGTDITIDFIQRGVLTPTILELPRAAIIIVIPIGSLLLLLQCLRRGWDHLKLWKAGGESA